METRTGANSVEVELKVEGKSCWGCTLSQKYNRKKLEWYINFMLDSTFEILNLLLLLMFLPFFLSLPFFFAFTRSYLLILSNPLFLSLQFLLLYFFYGFSFGFVFLLYGVVCLLYFFESIYNQGHEGGCACVVCLCVC